MLGGESLIILKAGNTPIHIAYIISQIYTHNEEIILMK